MRGNMDKIADSTIMVDARSRIDNGMHPNMSLRIN